MNPDIEENPTNKVCSTCPNNQNRSCEKRTFDVLIIGAGAIGCSIARELSKYQLKIAVVEQFEDVSQGASKANSGIVHGGYDESHGTLKAALTHRANRMFAQLNSELGFGFREIGSLVVGFNDEDLIKLQALFENGRKNGVQHLYLLDQQEVRHLEPHIHPDVKYALYCPDAGITSPYEYTMALAENAVANGVELWLGAQVVQIHITPPNSPDAKDPNKRFQVMVKDTVPHREIDEPKLPSCFWSAVVINCAGLSSDRIASMVGANNFKIIPRKGEYVILDKSQGHLARHVLFPVPSKERGKGILVSPTFHGNLLLGPTARDPSDTANPAHNNLQVMRAILSSARHTLPDFNARTAITSYSGFRAKSNRRDFIIEESLRVKKFINVAGIDSPGLTCSPMVAKRVAEILHDSCHLELRKNPHFQPKRPAIIVKKDADWTGRVDDDDPAKNIICRCEKVTEAEILDAMRRPIKAKTVESVKKATRAGMGPCQGNFCEPRVVELIAKERGIPESRVHRRGKGSSILPHRRVTEQDREMLEHLIEEQPPTPPSPATNTENKAKL